jgi:hypothetical protein
MTVLPIPWVALHFDHYLELVGPSALSPSLYLIGGQV